MGKKGSSQWEKLIGELSTLRTKKKTGGLSPEQLERLAWLEERFGEAAEVTRIEIDDQQERGPKRLTSNDHFATEVSTELLDQAEKYEPTKAWEQDFQREPQAKFEAQDSREGKRTFKQNGLSPFAVDLTEDFRDSGFGDDQAQEEDAAHRQSAGRVNYVDEEIEPAVDAPSANPFAIQLDAGLSGTLDGYTPEEDSSVPDAAAKSFEAELPDDLEGTRPLDLATRIDADGGEVQSLYEQSAEVQAPEEAEGPSLGELTTHTVEGIEADDQAGYDLMRAAMEYEEALGLSKEAVESREVGEPGEGVEPRPQPEDSVTGAPVAAGQFKLDAAHATEPAGSESSALGVLTPGPSPASGGDIASSDPGVQANRSAMPPRDAQRVPRPLPALNLEAAAVKPPAPPPISHQVDPDLPADLFDESGNDAVRTADAEPIIIGPAPPRFRRAAVDRAGMRARRTSQPNDLTGPRRATVHFRDGVNRRGVVGAIDTDAPTVRLEPMPGSAAPAEDLVVLALKAIFLLLPRGADYPDKRGHFCKVLMSDGRLLEGHTPDYDPARKAFTLFPAEDRGNIERVIVYNEAVKNLWLPES